MATVGSLTFPIVQKYVDDIVTVTEEEIANAILLLLEQEKTLVEGAGSVGFATLCNRKIQGVAGKNVAVIISGGNIDLNMLSKILERGRAKDGRLTHLKVRYCRINLRAWSNCRSYWPVTALTSCKSFTSAPFHKPISAKCKSPLPTKLKGTSTCKRFLRRWPRRGFI